MNSLKNWTLGWINGAHVFWGKRNTAFLIDASFYWESILELFKLLQTKNVTAQNVTPPPGVKVISQAEFERRVLKGDCGWAMLQEVIQQMNSRPPRILKIFPNITVQVSFGVTISRVKFDVTRFDIICTEFTATRFSIKPRCCDICKFSTLLPRLQESFRCFTTYPVLEKQFLQFASPGVITDKLLLANALSNKGFYVNECKCEEFDPKCGFPEITDTVSHFDLELDTGEVVAFNDSVSYYLSNHDQYLSGLFPERYPFDDPDDIRITYEEYLAEMKNLVDVHILPDLTKLVLSYIPTYRNNPPSSDLSDCKT